MRFEVGAAYVLGVLLPVGETIRRWGKIESITSYADDLLIGGLLLVAAWSVTRRKRWGSALLIAAWGVLCGGLYYSFFGQLERGASADPSGLANGVVVAMKGAIYIVAITSLVRATECACRCRLTGRHAARGSAPGYTGPRISRSRPHMNGSNESLWNAEANRWNVGKLIVGLCFIACFSRTMHALRALFDEYEPINPLSAPAPSPWTDALYYGAWSVALVVAFWWLESKRRKARGSGNPPIEQSGAAV